MNNQKFNLEEVLEAFATEFTTNQQILSKYLVEFPQHSIELVDLSRELSRMELLEGDESRDDVAFIEARLKDFQAAQTRSHSIEDGAFRIATEKFGIPFSIMKALKERRVEPPTIANHLLELIAKAMETTSEALYAYLLGPINVSYRASKSDSKPIVGEKVSFDKILHDANISSEALADKIERGL